MERIFWGRRWRWIGRAAIQRRGRIGGCSLGLWAAGFCKTYSIISLLLISTIYLWSLCVYKHCIYICRFIHFVFLKSSVTFILRFCFACILLQVPTGQALVHPQTSATTASAKRPQFWFKTRRHVMLDAWCSKFTARGLLQLLPDLSFAQVALLLRVGALLLSEVKWSEEEPSLKKDVGDVWLQRPGQEWGRSSQGWSRRHLKALPDLRISWFEPFQSANLKVGSLAVVNTSARNELGDELLSRKLLNGFTWIVAQVVWIDS